MLIGNVSEHIWESHANCQTVVFATRKVKLIIRKKHLETVDFLRVKKGRRRGGGILKIGDEN